MRVAIIPTGVMELSGLEECLNRLFPEHEIVAVPRVPGRLGTHATPFSQCFTNRVVLAEAGDVPTDLAKVVQELAGQVYPPRDGAADLAIVIDDLELMNVDQPGVAVEAILRTVRRHVEGARLRPHERTDLARCLRERASFHFAVPMTEAWFFASAGSVADNGVPEDRPHRLRGGVDPEAFETDDPLYSADDGSSCTTLLERNTRHHWEQRRAPWLVAPQADAPWFTRERHPKAYRQWLCRDPNENWCTAWQESKGGAAALQKLTWRAVLANPAHCTYARAFVDDLADALGEPVPFPPGGALAEHTRRKPRAGDTVLRNL